MKELILHVRIFLFIYFEAQNVFSNQTLKLVIFCHSTFKYVTSISVNNKKKNSPYSAVQQLLLLYFNFMLFYHSSAYFDRYNPTDWQGLLDICPEQILSMPQIILLIIDKPISSKQGTEACTAAWRNREHNYIYNLIIHLMSNRKWSFIA